MGRPKKKSNQRSQTIWVRVTKEEMVLVEKAAAREGLPTSTWARANLLKAAR